MKFAVVTLAILAIFCALAGAAKDPVCSLRHSLSGNGLVTCAGYFPMWSYDALNDECVEFVYGGCGGNTNRFPTLEMCEKRCRS